MESPFNNLVRYTFSCIHIQLYFPTFVVKLGNLYSFLAQFIFILFYIFFIKFQLAYSYENEDSETRILWSHCTSWITPFFACIPSHLWKRCTQCRKSVLLYLFPLLFKLLLLFCVFNSYNAILIFLAYWQMVCWMISGGLPHISWGLLELLQHRQEIWI